MERRQEYMEGTWEDDSYLCCGAKAGVDKMAARGCALPEREGDHSRNVQHQVVDYKCNPAHLLQILKILILSFPITILTPINTWYICIYDADFTKEHRVTFQADAALKVELITSVHSWHTNLEHKCSPETVPEHSD